jgi:hypothetical protein
MVAVQLLSIVRGQLTEECERRDFLKKVGTATLLWYLPIAAIVLTGASPTVGLISRLKGMTSRFHVNDHVPCRGA